MRKILIVLSALALFVLIGCQQAQEVKKSPQQETSTATITVKENPNAAVQ